MADRLRHAKAGFLYFSDWSVCDPRALGDARRNLYEALYPLASPPPETVTLSRSDALRLGAAVDAYVHLTTHPAGSGPVVEQLRAIRRAIREPSDG